MPTTPTMTAARAFLRSPRSGQPTTTEGRQLWLSLRYRGVSLTPPVGDHPHTARAAAHPAPVLVPMAEFMATRDALHAVPGHHEEHTGRTGAGKTYGHDPFALFRSIEMPQTEEEAEEGPPIFAPMTGYDMFLARKYANGVTDIRRLGDTAPDDVSRETSSRD